MQGADKQPIIMKKGKKKFFTSTNRRKQPEQEKSRNSHIINFSDTGNTDNRLDYTLQESQIEHFPSTETN